MRLLRGGLGGRGVLIRNHRNYYRMADRLLGAVLIGKPERDRMSVPCEAPLRVSVAGGIGTTAAVPKRNQPRSRATAYGNQGRCPNGFCTRALRLLTSSASVCAPWTSSQRLERFIQDSSEAKFSTTARSWNGSRRETMPRRLLARRQLLHENASRACSYFGGSASRSLVFMNARRPPCERKFGSAIGGRSCSPPNPRANSGLGLNFGGPP